MMMDIYCAKSWEVEVDFRETLKIDDESFYYFRLDLSVYNELHRTNILKELNNKTVLSMEYAESEEITDQGEKLEVINILHSMLNSPGFNEELKISISSIQKIFLYGYLNKTTVFID